MSNPLPADRIAEAREIIARATDGPWTVDRGEDWSEDYPRNITIRCPCSPPGSSRQVAKMSGGGMPYMDPDAEFIAAARTGWPEALDALESAQSRAERAEAWIRDNVSWVDGHACATGDCAHTSQAECIGELIGFMQTLAGNARCAPDEAEAAGMPPNSYKARAERAEKALREIMRDEECCQNVGVVRLECRAYNDLERSRWCHYCIAAAALAGDKEGS